VYEKSGKVCNFSRWLQFFAFDVIGELTWSKRIGFIERDEDVSGIIEFISGFLDYAGPVSYHVNQGKATSKKVSRSVKCLFWISSSRRT
jgi:hypothetical protein